MNEPANDLREKIQDRLKGYCKESGSGREIAGCDDDTDCIPKACWFWEAKEIFEDIEELGYYKLPEVAREQELKKEAIKIFQKEAYVLTPIKKMGEASSKLFVSDAKAIEILNQLIPLFSQYAREQELDKVSKSTASLILDVAGYLMDWAGYIEEPSDEEKLQLEKRAYKLIRIIREQRLDRPELEGIAEFIWNNCLRHLNEQKLYIISPNPEWKELREKYPNGKGAKLAYELANRLLALFPDEEGIREQERERIYQALVSIMRNAPDLKSFEREMSFAIDALQGR